MSDLIDMRIKNADSIKFNKNCRIDTNTTLDVFLMLNVKTITW